jgi:hypothetical protein
MKSLSGFLLCARRLPCSEGITWLLAFHEPVLHGVIGDEPVCMFLMPFVLPSVPDLVQRL